MSRSPRLQQRNAVDRIDDHRRTVFLGHGISPEHLARSHSAPGILWARCGSLLAIVGILFAAGGASIDTVFAGAYNLAQFCGWEWGRYRHPKGAPRFALTWFVLLVLAMGIVMTGVDPVVSPSTRSSSRSWRSRSPTSQSCWSQTTARTWAGTATGGLQTCSGDLPRRDHSHLPVGNTVDDPDQRRPELIRGEMNRPAPRIPLLKPGDPRGPIVEW